MQSNDMKVMCRRDARNGVASVELAFVLPVLLILLFGFVEVGWFLNSHQVLHNAVSQGARAAVRQANSNAEVEAAVLDVLDDSIAIQSGDLSVQLTVIDDLGQPTYTVNSLDSNEEGSAVRVTASLDYSLMNPPSSFLGIAPSVITGSAVMQRSQ